MRVNWKNFGEGLSGIAEAKMTADAADILKRKQEEKQIMGGLTPEDTGRIDTYNSDIAAKDNAEFGTDNSGFDYQYGPQDQKQVGLQSSFAGKILDKPMSAQEVRAQNTQDAIDFWKTKGTFGKEGLKTLSDEQTAETQRATAGLQQKHLQRTIDKETGQDTADKDVAALLDKAHAFTPGTPEHQAILDQAGQRVTSAYGAVKGQEYLANQFKLSEQKRESEIKKREDGLVVASRSPDAAVEWYNKQYKNGETAKIVDAPGGGKQIVHVDADGKTKDVILSYTDWNKEGRANVIQNIPKFAEEAYKLDKQHESKMAEIAETGRWHVKQAAALRADKEVKMTPDQERELSAASKAVRDASNPDSFDEKKYAAARHQFNSVVREIGVKNKNFGMIPDDRVTKPTGLSEMSAADLMKARESAKSDLAEHTKGWDKLPLDAKDELINNRLAKLHGNLRVKGETGGKGATSGGGGNAALAAAAEEAKKKAAAAGGSPAGQTSLIPRLVPGQNGQPGYLDWNAQGYQIPDSTSYGGLQPTW